MSIVLNEEKRSELPLITFTTCVPAAVGVALFALIVGDGLYLAVAAWVLASIGMAASIAHLAKPLRAPRALTNLKSSWLSREIALVGTFWALLLLWGIAELLGASLLAFLADLVSVAMGVPLMAVIARAYKVSTRPAWCGSEGLAELWACSLGAGSALCGLFAASVSFLALAALCVFAAAGFGIDVWSHKARKRRLESLRTVSDERVSLTLVHYEKLWPLVVKLWAGEALCVLILAVAIVFDLVGVSAVAIALFVCSAAGQLLVHGMHRYVFYEVPVQVRWVQRLRK